MKKKLATTKFKTQQQNRSEEGDFFKTTSSMLYLADGKSFKGNIPKHQLESIDGEVVFNTGMSGYVESLTDPSYLNQILVFTYPLIGNYGVQVNKFESNKIHVRGVVFSELAQNYSHGLAQKSLYVWLKEQNVPFITNVDTRALTKHLRSHGTVIGAIGNKPKSKFIEHNIVSVSEPIVYNKTNKKTVIVVDCGAKNNIIESLKKFSVCVKVVPYNYDFTKEKYNGVLITNGPGDPTNYKETITNVKRALNINKPMFGICLGNQIMALAAGAKTYKLPFGHRGHNQPCIYDKTKRAYITSQNHGYAVDEKSLPKQWFASFINANDGSVEGISHNSKPFSAVQFHPEACPGPTDTEWLFERFRKQL